MITHTRAYLSHEGPPTDWMKNLCKTDHVEITIIGNRFTGRARVISEAEVFNRGKHALYHKYYGLAPHNVIDDWFLESSINKISAIEDVVPAHR